MAYMSFFIVLDLIFPECKQEVVNATLILLEQNTLKKTKCDKLEKCLYKG